MSEAPRENRRQPWYFRPSRMLPVLAAAISIVVLFSPMPNIDSGESRLTSYSADAGGARLLYELAGRAKWDTRRFTQRELVTDSNAVIALLAPRLSLRGHEIHQLLEHVRGGGGLLLVPQNGAVQFLDSLRMTNGDAVRVPNDSSRECPATVSDIASRFSAPIVVQTFDPGIRAGAKLDTLFELRTRSSNSAPAVLAMQVGEGRIVVVADADMLRNDYLRVCRLGLDVVAVRALEYLRSDKPPVILFDEYHQGFGAQPGSMGAILSQFAATPAGRAMYQLAGAGLILLLAAAPRALPPIPRRRIERRSPLEHVDALARAYLQVGATRTGARRLVRGMRRRLERARAESALRQDDAEFLESLRSRNPTLSDDIEKLQLALGTKVDRAQFTELANAIARIEQTLTRI